jgi:hypothetical protein
MIRACVEMKAQDPPPYSEAGTAQPAGTSNTVVDDDERQALRDEGLYRDDPAVIAAIDLVRWELSLGTQVGAPARRPSVHCVQATTCVLACH